MPEYLESIFIILFEIFCCDMFFSAFGNIRAESRKWLRICLFIFLAAADFICSYLPMNFIVKEIVVILCTACVMYYFYDISFKRSSVLMALYQGLLVLLDYLV